MNMKVADIMTPNLTTVPSAATLADASRRMRDANVGALPVVDGRHLRGIITDRDIIVRAGAQHWNLTRKLVSDVMTASVRSCRDTDTVEGAARAMASEQIRRLPVENAARELIGMVSLGDIALSTPHEVAGDALAAISHHGEVAIAS
jgi:CBS domain-containing protein